MLNAFGQYFAHGQAQNVNPPSVSTIRKVVSVLSRTNSPAYFGDKLTHLTQLMVFLRLVCFCSSHASKLRFTHSLSTQPPSHTHIHRLFVTRSQQEQVEGTVPHAELSFCRSLFLTKPEQTRTN